MLLKFVRTIKDYFKHLLLKGEKVCFDFVVQVEGKRFPCNRIFLEENSGYFQGLFRSGMKEVVENRVELFGMSNLTFKFILDILNHVDNVLTSHNVCDIWLAADRLDIQFIAADCRKYALENINHKTVRDMYQCTKLLMDDLPYQLMDYIAHNFHRLKNHPIIMELEARDFSSLINNPHLITVSHQLVIETVMKWVDHSCSTTDCEMDNLLSDIVPRSELLADLLSPFRLRSLNTRQLSELSQHPHLKNNKYVSLVIQAARATIFDFYWQSASRYFYFNYALRRNRRSVAYVLKPTHIIGFDLRKLSWINPAVFSLPFSMNKIKKFTKRYYTFNLVDGNIYACGYDSTHRDHLSILHYQNNSWCREAKKKELFSDIKLPGKFYSLTIARYIYIVQVNSRAIYVFIPSFNYMLPIGIHFITQVPTNLCISYVIECEEKIIVFCDRNEFSEVWMLMFDTLTYLWLKPQVIKNVTAKGMTSFMHKETFFLLMSNGAIYKFDRDNLFLEPVTCLDNFDFHIIGSEMHKNDLILFVKSNVKSYISCLRVPMLGFKIHLIKVQDNCMSVGSALTVNNNYSYNRSELSTFREKPIKCPPENTRKFAFMSYLDLEAYDDFNQMFIFFILFITFSSLVYIFCKVVFPKS